jgi:hypothetical protein
MSFVSKAAVPACHTLFLLIAETCAGRKEHFARSKTSSFARIIASRAKANFDYRLGEIGEIEMREIQANPGSVARRPTSSRVSATIQPLRKAAARLSRRSGRFEIYDFLEAIYRVYIDWMCRKIAKRSAQTLADELRIVQRKGMSSIRVLIEATLPDADFKQKSRWVRALEYAYSENVPAKGFRKFVRRHGGLAGCARFAVQVDRKRKRPQRDCVEGDWDD